MHVAGGAVVFHAKVNVTGNVTHFDIVVVYYIRLQRDLLSVEEKAVRGFLGYKTAYSARAAG